MSKNTTQRALYPGLKLRPFRVLGTNNKATASLTPLEKDHLPFNHFGIKLVITSN